MNNHILCYLYDQNSKSTPESGLANSLAVGALSALECGVLSASLLRRSVPVRSHARQRFRAIEIKITNLIVPLNKLSHDDSLI